MSILNFEQNQTVTNISKACVTAYEPQRKAHHRSLIDIEKDYETIGWQTFDYLALDIFSCFWLADVNFVSVPRISLASLPNYYLLQILIGLDEYATLRSSRISCIDNASAAMQATLFALSALIHMVSSVLSQVEKKILRDNILKETKLGFKISDDPQILRKTLHDMFANRPAMKRSLQICMSRLLHEVSLELNLIENLVATWGTSAPIYSIELPHFKLELARRLRENQKLRNILKLLGALRIQAEKAKNAAKDTGRQEIEGIYHGHNLADATPVELIKLGMSQVGETDVIIRSAKGQLQIYEHSEIDERKTEKRGPIIICIDESSSMSGMPEIFSKALGLAICEQLFKDQRDLAWVRFSTDRPEILHMRHDDRYEDLVTRVIQLASEFRGGGTDFDGPLQAALQIIDECPFDKADIVFITDGDCRVSTDFLQEFRRVKDQKEFRCLAFSIAAHISPGLSDFADEIVDAAEMITSTDVEHLVETGRALHWVFQA